MKGLQGQESFLVQLLDLNRSCLEMCTKYNAELSSYIWMQNQGTRLFRKNFKNY